MNMATQLEGERIARESVESYEAMNVVADYRPKAWFFYAYLGIAVCAGVFIGIAGSNAGSDALKLIGGMAGFGLFASLFGLAENMRLRKEVAAAMVILREMRK